MPKRILWMLPLLALLMAGCGQKGPLYLPDQKPDQKSGEKR